MTDDAFNIKRSFLVHLWIQIVYPVVLIAGTLALVGTGVFELEDWGPLLLAALGIWGLYDLVQAIRWSGFRVVLSDDSIRIGGAEVSWPDVASARIQKAFGTKPAITLRTRGGAELEVPAAIDGLEFIRARIERNVPEVAQG